MHNNSSNLQDSLVITKISPSPTLFVITAKNPGHIAPRCPEPKRLTSAANASQCPTAAHYASVTATPLYLSVPTDSFANRVPAVAPKVAQLTHYEKVDEQEVIIMCEHGQKVELPLYHVLSQMREKQEVFAFSAPPQSPPATSVLHSFTKSPGGQDMLTI